MNAEERPIDDPQTDDPIALVLEPDPETAATLERLAAQRGFLVQRVSSPAEAERAFAQGPPTLSFLGIDIDSRTSLETLGALHERAPGAPVVVLSTRTDPETIRVALSYGASNVIARPLELDEVRFVLDRFYRFAQVRSHGTAAFTIGEKRATELSFRARPGVLSSVIAFLTDELEMQFPGHERPMAEIKLALYEAFANAMEHGNLGISFAEKSAAMASSKGLSSLIQSRLADPALAARRVFVRAEYKRDAVGYVVRDEGAGFDFRQQLSQPMAETSALHGRGLKMIAFHMDEVFWNDAGNEVRMHKSVRAIEETPTEETPTEETPTRPNEDGTR